MSVMFDPEVAIYPFPPRPTPLNVDEKQFYRERAKHLLKERDAAMVVHYYTNPEIQQLAEETGGCVSDSLGMTRSDSKHSTSTLLVAGMRFMGETAKILSPGKTILMPTLQTEYSLDLGCPVDTFSAFYDTHPNHTVAVYASTSAAAKARADWVITSSIAVKLIEHLDSLDERVIWAPDRRLDNYVRKQTGAGVLCWQGAYIIHDEFETQALARMEGLCPDTAVLMHPESSQSIVDMADMAGSTSQLINAAKSLPHQQLIMATNRGTFYKMQQAVPDKELLEVPTADEGTTCRSCTHCPWMTMNGLEVIAEGLEQGGAAHEIHVDAALREEALLSLDHMSEFAATFRT